MLISKSVIAIGILILFYSLMFGLDLGKLILYLDSSASEAVAYSSTLLASTGVMLSLVGLCFSGMAEHKASKAAKNSADVQEQLIEQHILVSSMHETYQDSFEEHITRPLGRSNIVSARLLLSTPSYGSPPQEPHAFVDIVRKFPEDSEIVMFSPDAHFDHWATILLAARDKEGATVFANFLRDISDVLRQFEPPDERRVWATHDAKLRLSYYAYGSSDGVRTSNAYMVFVDDVSPDTSLEEFKARCFGIPRSWHDQLFLQAGSYFNEFKRCPYSGRTSEKSVLKREPNGSDEFAEYKWDLLLGRTSRVIWHISYLNEQLLKIAEVEQCQVRDIAQRVIFSGGLVLKGMLNDPQIADVHKNNPLLISVLENIPDECPSGTEQSEFQKLLDAILANDELKQLVQRNQLSPPGLPEDQTKVLSDALDWIQQGNDRSATGAVYLMVGSGFGVSRLAMARR